MLTEEQIEVAVNWWANVMKNPKFDNGDDSQQGGMAGMLATMGKQEVSVDQTEKFKVELRKVLEGGEVGPWGLSVDYHADQNLAKAMDAAGVPRGNAPWKTSMTFRDGAVKVRYGYGAEQQQLYPEG